MLLFAVGLISTAASSPREGKLHDPSHRWSQVAERGSLWGMRITAWSYRRLGRRVCGALVHAIVAYFFLTDRKGRRASAAYLRRVYATPEGRANLGQPPGRWQGFLHYREFAMSIVDRIGIWFGHVDDFNYEMIGEEHLDHVAEEGRGAILVGAHLGSFDALRLLAERKNSIVNVLMFTANAERINTLFRELSPDMDTRVIQVDPASIDSVFEIRACLRRGELVAILGDRIEPGDQNRAVRIPFFGDSVKLSEAPYLLAALLDCPVLMILAFREASGRYSVYAEKLADRVCLPRHEREKGVSELLDAYVARLEFYCKQRPLQWFNFFDYWGDEAR
jgi:predicted LPLAT superfamily acyltransferase